MGYNIIYKDIALGSKNYMSEIAYEIVKNEIIENEYESFQSIRDRFKVVSEIIGSEFFKTKEEIEDSKRKGDYRVREEDYFDINGVKFSVYRQWRYNSQNSNFAKFIDVIRDFGYHIIKDDVASENLANDDILNLEDTEPKIKEIKKLSSIMKKPSNSKGNFERNRLIFGAPGTGKSRLLENDRAIFGDNYERVTFYEDYSYSQFVGSYKPQNDYEGNIIYRFIPGPFLRVLSKAIKNSDKQYLLIIEEISRANAASVFGDMFQLLDRNEHGEGEYEVHIPYEIEEYLKLEFIEELEEYDIEVKSLKLPSNFYLWATMNCADQGVFLLDAAFKRRFDEYKLMDINENENVINDIEVEIQCNEIGLVNWNQFRRVLNEYLLEKNVKDDKLIGPFFIKPAIFSNNIKIQSVIKDKLLMYLLEDVVKKSKGLFDCNAKSLTKINEYYGYKDEEGKFSKKVFCDEFMRKLYLERVIHNLSDEISYYE